MSPPLTEQTTSSRYENSLRTRLSMERSTVLIAGAIRCFMSSIFAGSDGVQTFFLTYPTKKVTHSEVRGSGGPNNNCNQRGGPRQAEEHLK